MKNKYYVYLMISTLACLLPTLIGVLNYQNIPDQLPTHFNLSGQINRYDSKFIVVFVLPIMLALIGLVAGFIVNYEKANQNNKLRYILLVLFPLVSGINVYLMFKENGDKNSFNNLLFIFLGLLFIVIGNYLPKTRRNYTIGLKLPWTLQSDENWNKTHRLAGYFFMIGGLFMISLICFNETIQTIVIIFSIIIMTIVPSIYSYVYYLKHQKVEKN